MSTKAHFIYENGVEGYEETSEPQNLFGSFIGFNVYIILELHILKSFILEGQYIYIETTSNHIPETIKFWGDAVIKAEWDQDGLLIVLKGGHSVTLDFINKHSV